VVHHPIDAIGFIKILKELSLFSLQGIDKVAGGCYCRYCYMVFLTTSTPFQLKPDLILFCLSIKVRTETDPVDCIIFMRCPALFLYILDRYTAIYKLKMLY